MARGAWLALLAAPLLFAANGASAGPVSPDGRGDAPIWEKHGAGRTDGLAVGAYPLPPQAEREDRSLADDMDGRSKERWLRRHYQWLRALGAMLRSSDSDGEARVAAAPRAAAVAASERPGQLRVDDMVVLYAADDAERVAPHLLDDGGRYEDPEIGGGEALDYIVRDRLTVESAKVVAEFIRPVTHGVRNVFGGLLTEQERPRPLRYDPGPRKAYQLADLESAWLAAASANAGSGASGGQQRPPAERVSMLDFFKGIARDILSAPTTYLLTLLALLGWLILRATVFSRN